MLINNKLVFSIPFIFEAASKMNLIQQNFKNQKKKFNQSNNFKGATFSILKSV